MTDDFKNKLMKYLTGNLAIETGSNVPQFLTPTSLANNIKSKLDVYFPEGYSINGSLQGKDADENGLPLNVIYGNYVTSPIDEVCRGFIYILDTNYEEIQMITEYSGGTDFGQIETLNVANDGTIYGTERTGTLIAPTIRLILLNNFLLKLPDVATYSVVYRISYDIPSTNDGYYTSQVIKNENAGFYFISGTEPNVYGERQPVGKQLEIVVGGSNVWTEYRTTTETRDYALASSIATWNVSNVISFKMVGWLSDDIGGRNYVEYTNNVSDDLVEYMINPAVANITYYTALIIDNNTVYVEYAVGELPTLTLESIYMGYINYSTNAIVNMFTLLNISALESSRFYFFKSNNQPFYAMITDSNTATNTIKVGKIIGTNYYETTLGTTSGLFTLSMFSVTNQFNLYDYYVQIDNTVFECKQIYNVLNYNGVDYSNINSLVPNNAILYDESDIVIFARNLYNISINNNTTTSTIEIPNNYLNDITIAKEDLLGETNSVLVDQVEDITKNIYESVLLNFVNSLVMKNSNDPLNEIINITGGIRINDSISDTNDYTNARALKFKRIFSDDSYDTFDIPTSQITYVGNTATINIYTYIPSDKTISKFQILSYDLVTLYLEIDASSYASDKFYKINQDMEVI